MLNKMKKIVYLSLSWIGDYLMQTLAINQIKQKYPDSKFDLITMSSIIWKLWKYSWLFDNIYVFDFINNPLKEFKNLYQLWKQNKYYYSILAFPTYRKEYHIVQFILGAKRRLFHRFKTWWFFKEFHFLWTDYVYFDESKHNVDNNLLLLLKLWLNIDLNKIDKKYILKIPEKNIIFWQEFIEQKNITWKIIWIHPWSTNSPAAILRRWWYNNYIELSKELIKRWNTVLIFGWPEEKDDILKMKKKLLKTENIYFIEESFFNSIWILKNVDLLITNDNWFWHIWAWLWIKVLSLWWTTFDRWSRPIWEKVFLLKKTKEQPWYRYELKRKVPIWVTWWMQEIKIKDVLDKTTELLKLHFWKN